MTMSDIFHVDTQFLRNALNVFENPAQFEEAARSTDAAVRAGNVATLIDALDLCNLLILGERVVFDTDVGGGREEKILDQIDRIARRLGDSATGDGFRSSFAGVAPANDKIAHTTQLDAARGATAFFPRLARCARKVLDLFHLPHDAPSEPQEHLIRFVESKKQPTPSEVEAIASKKQITGRRFYAALLTDETAFRALCDATTRITLTTDVLAVLFMNFRLRLAEQRSLAGRVFVGTGNLPAKTVGSLTYLPSMGRRDFCREFSRFVRWGRDPKTRNGHAFDVGLREYVLEEWEDVGCQLQLSERRAIPMVVAAVLGSNGLARSRTPETLLEECLRWRKEHERQISGIRAATREFELLNEEERKEKAAAFVAEMLKSPSTEAARNRAIGERLSVRDSWLGLGIRVVLNPRGALEHLVVQSTDKVRQHFEQVESREYALATRLSEAARPLLAGVGADIRQRLIDVFGGTVIDARNPIFDPDRFAAPA